MSEAMPEYRPAFRGHLLFSTVIEMDGSRQDSPARCLPRRSLRRALGGSSICRGDLQYAYLGSDWANGHGWSWSGAGILTRSQMAALVHDCDLYADPTPTLGTIGGPLSPGGVPDIVFETRNSVILVCRVTPVYGDDRDVGDRNWQRIRAAVLRQWSAGSDTCTRRMAYAGLLRHDMRWGPDGYAARVRQELACMRRRLDALDAQNDQE